MSDRNTTATQVRLSGEVTVVSAARLRAELLAAIASDGDIHVDLEQVEDMDLSAMQLFLAAAREAAAQGRTFQASVPAAVEFAAREIGFECFPGAVQASACPR